MSKINLSGSKTNKINAEMFRKFKKSEYVHVKGVQKMLLDGTVFEPISMPAFVVNEK